MRSNECILIIVDVRGFSVEDVRSEIDALGYRGMVFEHTSFLYLRDYGNKKTMFNSSNSSYNPHGKNYGDVKPIPLHMLREAINKERLKNFKSITLD